MGLPLLTCIQTDPLGAGSRFRQQLGDVARLNILFRRIWYFFNPEGVRQILVDHSADFSREVRQITIFQSFQGRNVLTTEGKDWERQRRILAPGFSPRRVAGYLGLMRAAVDDCVGSELPAEPGASATLDAGAFTTRLTMDVILRTLFSLPATREQAAAISTAIRALSRQSMRELFWAFVPPAWMPYPGRAAKLRHLQTINTFIARHVTTRAAEGPGARQDVLDMLLQARDDEAGGAGATLTSQEIHDNCIVLFGAGFDTSSSALTWWIGLIAAHPDAADRLRAELDLACESGMPLEDRVRLPYLNATIKEAMRLYPPSTALFTRVALRDVTITGMPVVRGTLVVIPIWHLHHDPRSFPDPGAFHPERFLPGAAPIPRSAYMPFGAGPRFCLGQHFATMEMALIAAELVRQFELSFDPDESLPEPVVDLALKPRTPLRIRFTRRPGTA